MYGLFVTDYSNPITANKGDSIGFDVSCFVSEDNSTSIRNDTNKPKKRSTKTKSSPIVVDPTVSAHLDNPIPGAGVAETDYSRTYGETSALLRGAIAQADQLSGEIKEDIDAVRASKTLKNKYTYITNLTGTASALLGTKISAIKELGSIATQINKMELDRFKTLKLDSKEETDDKRMMDIYSAFVNTPVGSYVAPSMQDLTIGVNAQNASINSIEMVAPGTNTPVTLTPEQNRMRMESNHNIQVVVRYDQSTGQRSFDVIDTNTGASIHNYPRPDDFLLEDTTIDVHSKIARNRNINQVWPLVTVGGSGFINEY